MQALLAYLILHPQAQFRHYLAGLFWPDSAETQARTNLRNLLHQLRQAFPDLETYIEINAQTLQWRKDAPCEIDVRNFEQALTVVMSGSRDREKLERALTYYLGDLLPACYDEWIQPDRERLRRAYLSALEALINILERNRDYPAALKTAQRLVQEDPLHAAANHSLIRLHALNGNQPAALKAYQTYTARLERELGTRPDLETRELYEQLKKQKKSAASDSGLSQHMAMVGRQSEWNRIQAVWQSAAQGSPQALFILGEAGIGKTRVVEELLDWASRQGIQTAVANCYPAEGSLPYAPVTTWLRARPLPRLENIWLSEIGRLLPEILSAHPRLPTPKPLTEAWQRQRMFEAVGKAILAEHNALLLVIEDIHWCDQDTLEWIHYLLRSNPKARLLIVATERSEETVAADHSLKRLQTALAAEGKINTLRLKALNQEDCLRLASQVAETETRQELSAKIAADIFQETEGNPLFIVEMTRLGQIPHQSGDDIPGPSKVQTVLKWRISQLSGPTRDLACAAAILGREFRLDVLQLVCKLGEDAFVQALNELLLRQIVREQTAERYDFSHDKLRQAVLSEISAAHHRLMHRKAAEAYLAITSRPSRTRHAEIAHHYESAGMLIPAIQYFRLAAEAAEKIYSTPDAIHNLEHALRLAKTCPPDEGSAEVWAQLNLKMADLFSMNGQFQQAQHFYEVVLAQPKTLSSAERTRAFCQLADTLSRQYRYADAQQAMDLAENTIDVQTKAGQQEWLNSQIARANLYYWSNEPDKMDQIIQRIAPAIEAGGQIDQLNELLTAQTMVRYRQERFRPSAETLKLYDRRLELLEKIQDSHAILIAHFQYGFGLVWSGHVEEGCKLMNKSLEEATRCGARIWELRALAYLSVAYRKLHRRPEALLHAQQTVEISTALNEPTYLGIGQATLGWVAWQEGKTAEAERQCRLATQTWNSFGGDVFHGLVYWVLLAITVERNDLQATVEAAQRLLDPNPIYRPILAVCAAALEQGLAALQNQNDASALAYFQRALELARADYEL